MSVDVLICPEITATDPATETAAAPRKRGGGARTQAGRDRSKRNSLQHGLMARVVFPAALAAAIAAMAETLTRRLKPADPYEDFLVAEMARSTSQLDHCAMLMRLDVQRVIDRAVACWDDDRFRRACDLGARLHKDPLRVSAALERTTQGCDWMVIHWEGLASALGDGGSWDEAQRELALDLLGVPAVLRAGNSVLPSSADLPGLVDLVEGQIARLREKQEESLDALDEAARSCAEGGFPQEEDAASARLRRYEASARRAWHWAEARWEAIRSPSKEGAAPMPRPECATNGPAIDFSMRRLEQKYEDMLRKPPEDGPAAPAEEPPAVAEAPAVVVATAPKAVVVAAPKAVVVAAPQAVAPVAAPQTVAPVAAPQTIAPVAAPQTIAPVAAPQTVAPVAAPQTIAPVAAPQTIAPAMSEPRSPQVLTLPTPSPEVLPGKAKGNRRYRRARDLEARKAARKS